MNKQIVSCLQVLLHPATVTETLLYGYGTKLILSHFQPAITRFDIGHWFTNDPRFETPVLELIKFVSNDAECVKRTFRRLFGFLAKDLFLLYGCDEKGDLVIAAVFRKEKGEPTLYDPIEEEFYPFDVAHLKLLFKSFRRALCFSFNRMNIDNTNPLLRYLGRQKNRKLPTISIYQFWDVIADHPKIESVLNIRFVSLQPFQPTLQPRLYVYVAWRNLDHRYCCWLHELDFIRYSDSPTSSQELVKEYRALEDHLKNYDEFD
jgi:hypothetical protein